MSAVDKGMDAGLRGRVAMLLAAAALIAGAAVTRVWLAATGGYSHGSLAVPLRVASAAALFGGFLLAGLVVAWPFQRSTGQKRPNDSDNA
jgi:hypothetical protein